MTRHMTVRYAEPASGAPWDWACPWCPGGYTSQAVSDAEALAAATCHAILEHAKGTPCVDVYVQDGQQAMRYGCCGDRTCGACTPRVEHTSADTCDICGGYGCSTCRNCPCAKCDPYVPEYVRSQIRR